MITDLLGQLTSAVDDMNAKQKHYGELNAQAAEAYKEYQKAYDLANSIRQQLTDQLTSIIPSDAPRARVL